MRDYNENFVEQIFGEQKPRYLGYYGGSTRTNKEKDVRSERKIINIRKWSGICKETRIRGEYR